MNPFSVASTYGNDFLQVSSMPGIDFACFNVYPDLYNVSGAVGIDLHSVPLMDCLPSKHCRGGWVHSLDRACNP